MHFARSDIKAWCTSWRIGCMPSKVSWAKTRCCYSTTSTARSTCKGHWNRKKTPKFRGRHWMLPSNIDWYERVISKRCWNICEGNQTKFEPHASCMYFGNISSYTNGGKALKNASRIPWKWEVLITHFNIMAQNSWNVFWQFNQDGRECKHWLSKTSQARLGICHRHVRKNRETFVAHTSTLHAKWGTMPYLLLPIWTKRGMDFGHLLTHVPFTIPNHFNGGKEISTM